MPVVTTLHTILQHPNDEQREVMKQLDALSHRFIVMAERGRNFLETIYGVAPEKIDLIPHGVIDMPFIDSNYFKDELGVEGKQVLLTFGLLSPNKGIEYAIDALPAIRQEHPDIVYIVLGETHPQLLRGKGRGIARSLEGLVADRGVRPRHVFKSFREFEELKEFIGAADIYLTPYLTEAQITSGTLAYAFGSGNAVVSTPYWHAAELLTEERGILVPFAISKAIAVGVVEFCGDRTDDGDPQTAWKVGREMVWPVVGGVTWRVLRPARMLESVVAHNRRRSKGGETARRVAGVKSRSSFSHD